MSVGAGGHILFYYDRETEGGVCVCEEGRGVIFCCTVIERQRGVGSHPVLLKLRDTGGGWGVSSCSSKVEKQRGWGSHPVVLRSRDTGGGGHILFF